MAAIDTIYNYYLTTYGSSSVNRYDTHKKSELRTIYNNIVKINKESPLYKIKESEKGETQQFAIDVKEGARYLAKTTASLSSPGSPANNAFKKKVATSSDEDIVSVSYVDNIDETTDLNKSFELEVQKIASPQVNLGKFVSPDTRSVEPARYTFEYGNNETSYEFQYTVFEKDTNKEVLNKIQRLVNTAYVGVNATVITNENQEIALQISSNDTGLAEGQSSRFQIKPESDRPSMTAMNIYGFDRTYNEASNSSFLLNGTQRSSQSNNFTISKVFQVELKGINPEGSPSTIGFKNDLDAITENVQQLTDAFNRVVNIAHNYDGSKKGTGKLSHEMSSILTHYGNNLESMGIMPTDSGTLSIDKALLSDMITSHDAEANFQVLGEFKNSLIAKANKMSLNPIDYVHKTVVTYKNPGRNFNAPYASSMYAGMMMDQNV